MFVIFLRVQNTQCGIIKVHLTLSNLMDSLVLKDEEAETERLAL
jgi:hypothetical protein